MVKLFRAFRPSDVNLGIYNGENLRLQRPTEGAYAGFSVVEASSGITVQKLKRDGWEVMPEPPPAVSETNMLSGGTLADLEAAIGGMSPEELSHALAVESSGRNRKGAKKLLEAALEAIQAASKVESAPEAVQAPEVAPEATGPESVHIGGEEP